jgi:hypothetical protein
MNEGVNHETKGSEIKFSECIGLGALGINLEADTSFSATSHQNEEKLPRHEQAEGYNPFPPHRTVNASRDLTELEVHETNILCAKIDIPRNAKRELERLKQE